MNTIFITDSSDTALFVAKSGVSTVMVDLEILGKHARQGHLDTVISSHNPTSISTIADAFKSHNSSCQLLVRTNPVHSGTEHEVYECIERGAGKLMLPMFKSPSEVQYFLSIVKNRVPVTLLLETPAACARLDDILSLPYDFDVHVGLNDLHLGFGLNFMFELLSTGIVHQISSLCHAKSVPFGFGGVARLSSSSPLSAREILCAHLSLGSTSVILSRDWRLAVSDGSFSRELVDLHEHLLNSGPFDMRDFFLKIKSLAGCYC